MEQNDSKSTIPFEFRQAALQADTEEELLNAVKESGLEYSEEQVKAFYASLHKTGELPDDELDNVAGGGCGKSAPRYSACEHWEAINGNDNSYYMDNDPCARCTRNGLYLNSRCGRKRYPNRTDWCIAVAHDWGRDE